MSEVLLPYDGRPRGHYYLGVDAADAQALLLALAICSLDRPGWHQYLRSIAEQLATNAGEQFDEFRRLNADRWHQPARAVESAECPTPCGACADYCGPSCPCSCHR